MLTTTSHVHVRTEGGYTTYLPLRGEERREERSESEDKGSFVRRGPGLAVVLFGSLISIYMYSCKVGGGRDTASALR